MACMLESCIYYIVFGTLWMWNISYFLGMDTQTLRASTRHKKNICNGFPAKWLIFTSVMFFPCVITGGYFQTTWLTHKLLDFYIHYLSIATRFSNNKWTLPRPVVLNEIHRERDNQCKFAINDADQRTSDVTTHCINTTATVFAETGLELLTPTDIQANSTSHLLHPIIFDTGASLVITGSTQDFLPNIYRLISTLKLGGMISVAAVIREGNVAWTFTCDNGEHLTLMTKCYHVPSPCTRLLSPQKLFDKVNGNPGRYWGNEELFHLEYTSKPALHIPYVPSSNLPIGYACTHVSNTEDQINLILLNEENQNLTSGQKLLFEYHYKFSHTNMPLVQQILRSEDFPQHKFLAASKCVYHPSVKFMSSPRPIDC